MIFHITTADAWDEAARRGSACRADTMTTEGFIYCSSADQVADVASVRLRRREGLCLLWINVPFRQEQG